MWNYKGQRIKSREDLPADAVGFVYRILNRQTEQVYIGKKILLNKRTRPPLKGYKRKRVDYIESGEHKEFLEKAFKYIDIDIEWKGEGVDEIGVVAAIEGDKAPNLQVGDVVVRVDPRYFRPAEVETLLGDPTNAKEKLGWVPEITVQEMCSEMVSEDLKAAQRHAFLKASGHDVLVSLEEGR